MRCNYKHRETRSQNSTYPPLSHGGFDGSASSWPLNGGREKNNMKLVTENIRRSIQVIFWGKDNRQHYMQANAYRNLFKHLQQPAHQDKSYRHRQAMWFHRTPRTRTRRACSVHLFFQKAGSKASFLFFFLPNPTKPWVIREHLLLHVTTYMIMVIMRLL